MKTRSTGVTRRMLALCLAVLLAWALLPTAAMATEPEYDAAVSAADVTVRPGGTVSVPLTLTGGADITGAVLSVSHDPALILADVSNGTALQGLDFTPPGDLIANPATIVWAGPSAVTGEGTLAVLTFFVPYWTPDGTYDVTLSAEYDGFCDDELNDLAVAFTPGSVTVRYIAPGDLNEDDRLNAKDIVTLQRAIAGGYGVTLEDAYADLNHDGKVNAKDIVLLQRAIAGGYGVTLTDGADIPTDPVHADLGNIVYVVNVFAVNSTDDYGNDTYKISAQVVDMDGRIATYLLASYKTEDGQVVPTEQSNGVTSALPDGTLGVSFNKDAAGFLTGATQTGFYTFKKSANSKLATLGIMEPTAVPEGYDHNDAPVYQKTTYNMTGQEINSQTVSITTTDGTAYLDDVSKFIVYGGTGAALTATVTTGSLDHVFTEEAAVLLSRSSDGSKVVEAVVINWAPAPVPGSEFYYADGHSFDFNTAAGARHNFYNEKGEKVAVTLDKGTTAVAKGFYRYSVDSEGIVTLGETVRIPLARLDQRFDSVYNHKIYTTSISGYSIAGAKLVDVRSGDLLDFNMTAPHVIKSIDELADLMNRDNAPEIYVDMYVDPDAKTVSLIFITAIYDNYL